MRIWKRKRISAWRQEDPELGNQKRANCGKKVLRVRLKLSG